MRMTHAIHNSTHGDAVSRWRSAIDDVQREMGGDRFRAATIARRRHPELARAARDACRR